MKMINTKCKITKKHIVYFLIALFFLLCFISIDAVYASVSSEHLGHEYDEDGLCNECHSVEAATQDEEGRYVIDNAGNLLWFADFVNNNLQNRGANAILVSDIDMAEALKYHVFSPIGKSELYLDDGIDSDAGYAGVFDGGGKVISNLVISPELDEGCSFGIFGTLSGTVKRLGIAGLQLCATNTSSDEAGALGGIAGQVLSDGVITDCYVANSVVACYGNYSSIAVGGIAGALLGGEILNCHTYGTEITGDSSVTGSLVGVGSTADERLVGSVNNCYSSSFNFCGEFYPCETENCGRFGSYPILMVSLLGDEWGFLVGTDTYPVLRNEQNTLFYGYRGCDAKKSYHNDSQNNNISRVNHSPDNITLLVEADKLCLRCEYCGAELGAQIEVSDAQYNKEAYSGAKAVYEDADGYFEEAVESHLKISYSTDDGNPPRSAGTYCAYLGSGEEKAEKSFSIERRALTEIKFSDISPVYNGTERIGNVTVYAGELGSVAEACEDGGVNYKLTWSNNVNAGRATVTAEGVGNFCGTVSVSFDIERCSLEPGEINGDIKTAHLVYNGKEQNPSFVLTVGENTLLNGVDYAVTYSENINAGEAAAKIEGIGNYKGSVSFTYTIHKKNVEIFIVPCLVEVYTGQDISLDFDYMIYGINEENPAVKSSTLRVGASLPSDSSTEGIWELFMNGEVDFLNYNVTRMDKGISYLVIKNSGESNCSHSFVLEYDWQGDGEPPKCKLSSVCQSCKTVRYSLTAEAVLLEYSDSDCETVGTAKYTADFAGFEFDTQKTVEISPKGHNWSGWSENTPETNRRQRSCTVCGEYQTEDMPIAPDSSEDIPEQNGGEAEKETSKDKDESDLTSKDAENDGINLTGPIIISTSVLLVIGILAIVLIVRKRKGSA